jgi:hypothetical protein
MDDEEGLPIVTTSMVSDKHSSYLKFSNATFKKVINRCEFINNSLDTNGLQFYSS